MIDSLPFVSPVTALFKLFLEFSSDRDGDDCGDCALDADMDDWRGVRGGVL